MALQYALVGTARAANTRSNYVTAAMTLRSLSAVTFTINGTDRSRWVSRFESEIIDTLNDVANTASLVVRGFTPAAGMTVVITRTLDGTKQFSGVIIKVTQLRRSAGSRLRYRLDCLDWSFLLDRRLVTNFYNTQSASAIAADLIATWTSGFTSTNVEAGLGSVEFQNKMETVSRALTRLADLVGAFWYVDYDKDLHFRVTENLTNPATLDTTIRTYKRLTYGTSIPQIRTRVKVEGGGVTAVSEVAVGEIVLPVQDTTWYGAAAGYVVAGSQQITYTGVETGGVGALVGPGVSPSVAPSLTAAVGTGLGIGVYRGAYTDVTASGETLPSPMGSVTTKGPLAIAAPSDTPVAQTSSYGYFNPAPHRLTTGATYRYGYTFLTGYGETVMSAPSVGLVASATFGINLLPQYTGLNQGNGIVGITSVNFYRSVNGGTYRLFQSASGSYPSPIYDLYLGDADIAAAAQPPGVGTADLPAFQQIAIAGVALGPTGTTSRKYYRTVVDGAQLKLQQTIANNTVTIGVLDVTADGSLGADAPTSDTAGLVQTFGQINPGATSILTAGAGPFSASGGWIRTSSGDLVRYTGVSGNTLTGIPASGLGAILTAILYGSQVVGVPALTGIPATGVGSILYTIKQGDPINLLVIVDDVPAQTVLAALEGGDGIHEHYIQDRRLSIAGATARGTAEITIGKDPDENVSVTSEDWLCQSGRSLPVNVAGISVTLKIHQVRIYWTPGRHYPQRDVTATNRFKDFYQYVREIEDSARRAV